MSDLPEFPCEVILTKDYQILGHTSWKGTVYEATGYDQELDAYLINDHHLVPRNVLAIATPELIEAAKRERSEWKARREARRKAWDEKRRVEQLISSAPPNPYADNPLFGLF
ncbi:hypothetical protein [Mesorhizobium sp.]|uniref:hypothetical protein n=1 Tax=Mesorhizobium sp. TaxID=1871066 RepID=UPI000FE74F35|nr:hypothetical protein [Mesorhizobium sp.]RWI35464.1 MAG: hypothetical protein EOR14_28595 [Mesorhizobium sp.]RWJ66367.1 MAG: hypothetical protein EOR34_28540 [Mesorhizobium sp.]